MEETDAKTNYAKSPAEIRERAEAIARDWRFNEAALAGAICSALVMERERCAKVADDYAAASYGLTEEEWAAKQIATSIRSGV